LAGCGKRFWLAGVSGSRRLEPSTTLSARPRNRGRAGACRSAVAALAASAFSKTGCGRRARAWQ
jgi:hypothetical protein